MENPERRKRIVYLLRRSFSRPLALKPGMVVGASWLATLVLGLVKDLVLRSRLY